MNAVSGIPLPGSRRSESNSARCSRLGRSPSSVIPGSNPRAKYWGRAGTSRVIFLLSFAALAVAPEAGRPPAGWNDHAAAVSRPAERRAKYGPPTPDARKATARTLLEARTRPSSAIRGSNPRAKCWGRGGLRGGSSCYRSPPCPAAPETGRPPAGRDDHAAAGLAGG